MIIFVNKMLRCFYCCYVACLTVQMRIVKSVTQHEFNFLFIRFIPFDMLSRHFFFCIFASIYRNRLNLWNAFESVGTIWIIKIELSRFWIIFRELWCSYVMILNCHKLATLRNNPVRMIKQTNEMAACDNVTVNHEKCSINLYCKFD